MLKKVLEYITNLWYSIFRIGVYMCKGGISMRERITAYDVANWFIWKNNIEKQENTDDCDEYEVYEGITHLKLQKLLYNAQGVCLALYNKPLFEEKIYAWEHGPVIKKIYDIFKQYGREIIPAINCDDASKSISKIENDSIASDVLNITYENFAIYTAWQLRNMSHIPSGPWETTVREKGMHKQIDNNLIEKYFRNNIISNE